MILGLEFLQLQITLSQLVRRTIIIEGNMCTSEILTIIALFLSLAALIVVSIQTVLTRKALDATRKSINLSRKVRELEMLPSPIIAVANDSVPLVSQTQIFCLLIYLYPLL